MTKLLKSFLVAAALGLGATRVLALGPGGVTSLDGAANGGNFYNTGVDATGAAVTGPVADLHYTIPAIPQSAVIPNNAVFPALVDDATYLTPSNWVAVNTTGAADANASYVYQTTFTVPAGYSATTASLFGQIAGNVSITNVILNGHTITTDPAANALSTHTSKSAYDRLYIPSADFIGGANTLQITVVNTAGVTASALRLQATVNAFPTPATLLPGGVVFTNTGGVAVGLYNTGVDNSGNPVATGTSQDTHWTLVSAPAGVTTPVAPFVTNKFFYPITTPGGWVADGAAQWISPKASYIGAGNALLSDPAGQYKYETTFNLTAAGLDPTTAILVGRFSIDDTLVEVDLNGTNTGIVGDSVESHSLYDHFDYFQLSGFVAGVNTLDFITRNATLGAGIPNPSGLQVQLEGVALRGASVPLPAAVALFPLGFAAAVVCKRRLTRGRKRA